MFLPIQVAKTSTLVWQGLILSEYSDDLETSVCNWKGSLHADKNQWQGIHARVHPGNFSNYIDKGKFSSAEIWGDDDISNLLPNPQGWEIRQCRQMENTRAPALIKLTGGWSWKLVPHRHPKSSIPLHTPLKTETKPANLVTNRAGWAHESPQRETPYTWRRKRDERVPVEGHRLGTLVFLPETSPSRRLAWAFDRLCGA